MIDEIRERTDLVALVERHVRLQRRGNSHVGLCPFHQEKSPSFHVVPHKHLFHCFGCGAGGDAFKFVMELEGLSFMEAVRELAQSAGIDLPDRELTPDERKKLRQRAGLYEVLEAASQFYEAVLMSHPEGQSGRDYLKKRGITPEIAMKWRLGFAPGGWTTTIDVLQRRGFSLDLILAAGLAKRKERDNGRISHYDTFRDRVTIPITDTRGRVLAFGARLLQGEGPKYLNSPETALYRKSSVLYGLEHARQPIQRRGRAILVEGYFDVIAMHEASFGEAVATCGTALTADHLISLKRMTDSVVAVFDSDEAGARAAERAVPMLQEAKMKGFRLELPGAKDPDELVREEGPQALEAALQRTKRLEFWVVDRLMNAAMGIDNRAERRERILAMVPQLAFVDDDMLIDQVGTRGDLPKGQLLELVRKERRQHRRQERRRDPMQLVPDPPPPPPPDAPPSDGPPPMEPPPHFEDEGFGEDDDPAPPFTPPPWSPTRDLVHILWLLVHRHALVGELAQALGPVAWAHQGAVVPTLQALLDGKPAAALLPDIEDAGVRRTLVAVVAREKLYTDAQAPRGMGQALHRLLEPQLSDHLFRLDREANQAYAQRDYEAQGAATKTALEIRKQIKRMKSALNAGDLSTFSAAAAAAIDRITRNTSARELSTGDTGG